MEFTIRKATKADAQAIWNLIHELAVFEKEPKAVAITPEDLAAHGFGSSPLFQCFVAECAAAVVGMALFYPRYSTWKGPTFHLEDLIVHEPYQGKGIGFALYREFIAYAYQQGVQRIEWAALDWNTKALDFYEKSGAQCHTDWNLLQMDAAAMKQFLSTT